MNNLRFIMMNNSEDNKSKEFRQFCEYISLFSSWTIVSRVFQVLNEKTQGINLKMYKLWIIMKPVNLPHILVGNTEISLKLW